jgi:hypothetical protein
VAYGRVDPGLFDLFEVPLLAGRGFRGGDLAAGASGVVVSRSFAEQVLGGASPVGRRIRYVEGYRAGGQMRAPPGVELGRWYEVVGVVSDFPPHRMEPDEVQARVYHPLVPGRAYPVHLALRTRGTPPAAFAPRLRETTARLDPTLRLHEVLPLDDVLRRLQGGMRLGGLALALLTLSVLLLSAAGIYAMMSFTVTRRRREIGIRSALGARPHRILRSVFSRAAGQLALGTLLGLLAAAPLTRTVAGEMGFEARSLVLPGVAALVLAVGLLAALGPARRGLRIQPMEALREE